MQTKTLSGVEVFLNALTGLFISWLLTVYILPLFGFKITIKNSLEISTLFTSVHVVKAYFWRRFFNWIYVKDITYKKIKTNIMRIYYERKKS